MSAWLVDTVLYSGVLIALVLVLRRPAGRLFGPQLAYALWALPLLRLLLPPIVLPASLAPEPARAPVTSAIEPLPAPIEAPVDMTAAPIDFATATPRPAWEWTDLIAPAVSVWAGVALAFLIFRVVTYRRMRRELLNGARSVGEIGRIRMVETPALATPVAFGVLDKVIALPPRFMAQPDLAARDLAIAHELAHHKGHDLLANFAAQALLALHWFNPLAWYGWRAMRRDQEAACDARVLAGRGRDERLRYAALIAGIATGPRSIAFERALAAPMACPVLGERSIVHRLRSISMSDLSRRRRWAGRSLFAASALALPLTASISYAAATAEAREPAKTLTASSPLTASHASAALAAAEPRARQVADAADGEAGLHPHPDGPTIPLGPSEVAPMPQFRGTGDPTDPEWQARMEEWGREMEQWGEQWGEKWAEWGQKHGEQWGKQWERWGEQQREQALAMAEHQRELGERQREQALVRAERQREQGLARAERQREQALARAEQQREQSQAWAATERRRASSALRNARESIAHNQGMSEAVRAEVLQELDEEIARIEHEDN